MAVAGASATFFFLFSSWLCLCSHARAPPSLGSRNSNATAADELALLSFKSMLHSDGPLESWNTSNHFCGWPGVACGRRHPGRVVALRMATFNLSGHISPSLGNLSFLRELDLGDNHLIGEIPPELGQLSRLQVLNLSTNYLLGSIPAAMGACTKLMTIDLGNNQLQGEIPAELGALKNLARLGLHENGLSGEIPPSLADLPSMGALSLFSNKLYGPISPAFGNLTNLYHLLLAHNMLSGSIPSSLGMLSRLSWLELGFNNLSGSIPTSIWNISYITELNFQQNMLSGVIPPDAFNALPHLQTICLNNNQLHGYIPASIANASNLLRVQIGFNSFSGIIPLEVGKLRDLTSLEIEQTLLEAKDPKGWGFISALTNCSNLQALFLGTNKFGGVLPDSLSNLSVSLEYLYLNSNGISGRLPNDIGNLVSLKALLIHNNSLTGTLPSSLGRIKGLQALYIYNNKISGPIQSIGNLTELNYLALGANAFSGRLPNTLGKLTKLLELDLSSNNFTGPIPSDIFNIPTLSFALDVSNNNLEGSIPHEIGNLNNLVEFYADFNEFSGEIPSTLGACQLLQNLYLQNNILTGRIPSLLSQLKGLENLDISSNNLSGQIPKFLGNLSMLYYLNISFNDFSGEVPTFGVFANASGVSIQGNDKLCGGTPNLHLSPCSSELGKRRHKFPLILVVSVTATIIILSLICIFVSWRKSTNKPPSTISIQGHPLISYQQLVTATDGFSTINLLGSGTFGAVFKANLGAQDGQSTSLAAVKVLRLQTPGALKSFTAECEALRNLRHRNLVKIITTCSSTDNRGRDFKAIVFDFMPNGSLEGWLHLDTNDQTEQKYLNLLERVTILLDVANALDYLHCHGPAPVVHCDVKPSNVLLDAEMVAHVGDFGLAKIIVDTSSFFQQSTSSMGFRGTVGYAPPEYGAGNMVSVQGDIYSYGVLVLETITGKRPTDSNFTQGLSLREYVELGLQGRTWDVVDTQLSLDLNNELWTTANAFSCKTKNDCLISLLRLGVSCSHEIPSNRMSTGDIIKELRQIKESLM